MPLYSAPPRVVAGKNIRAKVQVGSAGEHVDVTIHVPLPHTGRRPEARAPASLRGE